MHRARAAAWEADKAEAQANKVICADYRFQYIIRDMAAKYEGTMCSKQQLCTNNVLLLLPMCKSTFGYRSVAKFIGFH